MRDTGGPAACCLAGGSAQQPTCRKQAASWQLTCWPQQKGEEVNVHLQRVRHGRASSRLPGRALSAAYWTSAQLWAGSCQLASQLQDMAQGAGLRAAGRCAAETGAHLQRAGHGRTGSRLPGRPLSVRSLQPCSRWDPAPVRHWWHLRGDATPPLTLQAGQRSWLQALGLVSLE